MVSGLRASTCRIRVQQRPESGAWACSGMVASLTGLPVFGVPIRTWSLDELDSLLSILQMPKGIPVGTFPIGEAAKPALEAVRILSFADADLSDRSPWMINVLSLERVTFWKRCYSNTLAASSPDLLC